MRSTRCPGKTAAIVLRVDTEAIRVFLQRSTTYCLMLSLFYLAVEFSPAASHPVGDKR